MSPESLDYAIALAGPVTLPAPKASDADSAIAGAGSTDIDAPTHLSGNRITHYANLPLMLTATPSNLDTIASGALLALLEADTRQRMSSGWIDRLCDICGLVGAVAMALIMFERLSGRPEFGFVGGATAIALMALWLIRRARDVRVLRPFLFNRVTLFVGMLSYGIYLYHLFVGLALQAFRPQLPGWLFTLAASLLTLVVATASWYFVEKPFLRLKRRLH